MSESKSSAGGGGVGFCGLLAIVFITLKLTGHISWPWIWVLSPLWIPLPIAAVILLIAAVVIGVCQLLSKN